MKSHFSDVGQMNLTLLIGAINTWRRIAIRFQLHLTDAMAYAKIFIIQATSEDAAVSFAPLPARLLCVAYRG